MAKRYLRLFLGTALFAASSAVQAQGLRGTVRSSNGRPLEGAELTIANSSARARSDSLGRYAFPRLAAGRYALTVYYDAFRTIPVPFRQFMDSNCDLVV